MPSNDQPAASLLRGLPERTQKAVERNARVMKPKEYEWLRSQEFQPPIRRALVAEYERIHGATT